jgi:hypothetical protein
MADLWPYTLRYILVSESFDLVSYFEIFFEISFSTLYFHIR